ncbi:MAG: hypothetical protein U0Z17_08750 [Bacteroidales bacterium]
MKKLFEIARWRKCPGLNGELMFIARIGYVKEYPAPASIRPIESFTTFR